MTRREYHFWVYILANRSRNTYIGMTNDLMGRVMTHGKQRHGTYTAQYKIHRLVYFEYFRYVRNAIAREKELKHWTRAQKVALIERANPTWVELMPQAILPPERKAGSLRE